MTTKNAGEKEQGMSEGPYKTVPFHGADSDGYSEVVDSNGRVAYTTDEESARQVCKELNLAHHHATAAAARRVRELEEALAGVEWCSSGHCPACNGPKSQGHKGDCYVGAALAGKERSDGAE